MAKGAPLTSRTYPDVVTLVPAYAEIPVKQNNIAVIAKRDFVRAIHAGENPGREFLIVRVGNTRDWLGLPLIFVYFWQLPDLLEIEKQKRIAVSKQIPAFVQFISESGLNNQEDERRLAELILATASIETGAAHHRAAVPERYHADGLDASVVIGFRFRIIAC